MVETAIAMADHPTLCWYRHVDDTHIMLILGKHRYSVSNQVNSLDLNIKFIIKGSREEEGALDFLDTNRVQKEDESVVHDHLQKTHPHRPVSQLCIKPPTGAQTQC